MPALVQSSDLTPPEAAGASRWIEQLPRPALVLGLGAIALLWLLARLPGFNPPSLWLDDEWVAVLVKSASLSFLFEVRPPVPPGFVLALKGVRALLGDGEWQLQLLALLAGAAQVVAIGWLVRRVTGHASLGLLAAALLAGNPVLATYSLRAKAYALDGLLSIVLVGLAAAALRSGRTGRFLWLCAAGCAAIFLSVPSLFVAGAMVNVAAAALLLRPPATASPAGRPVAPSRLRLLLGWAGFHLAVLAFYLAFVRGGRNASLLVHWRNFFVPTDDLSAAAAFLSGRGARLFTGAFPEGLPWLAALIPVGLARLLWRRDGRALGLAMAGLYAGVVAAAALRLYPIGGGRTDLYAVPISILLAACALSGHGRWSRWLPPAAAALAAAHFLITLPSGRSAYPEEGGRAIVERANEIVRDEDGLVIYPWSNYAVGYYGRWPVRLVPVADSTNGFYVRLERERTLVLHETLAGRSFEAGPDVVERQLIPFLADGPERLVYVAVKGPTDPHAWIVRTIVSHGYRMVDHETDRGAIRITYERARPAGAPHLPAP